MYVRKVGRGDELGERIDGDWDAEVSRELIDWLRDLKTASYYALYPEKGRASGRKRFVVDEPQFNVAIGDIIFSNAIVIGYETDWCMRDPTACEASWSLYIIENVFTTIWVVEFFLRVRAHKLSGYFGDKSNLLDFFLAALSVSSPLSEYSPG